MLSKRLAALRMPLCGLAIVGLAACNHNQLCSSDVLQVARDLGSDRYATTEVRSCGATTGYATVVRVGRASEPQAAATEVFIADSDHGAATNGARGAVWMSVVWTAPGKLSVVYASKARVFKHQAEAKGATISYRAMDPIAPGPVP